MKFDKTTLNERERQIFEAGEEAGLQKAAGVIRIAIVAIKDLPDSGDTLAALEGLAEGLGSGR